METEEKVDTETATESQQEEKTDVSKDTSDTTKESDDSKIDSKIDYKSESQKDDEEKERKEPDLEKAKERFQKSRQKDEEDELDEDKPITKKELEGLLQKHGDSVKKETLSGRILEIADSLSGSPEEKDAVVKRHESIIFPSYMPLDEQMRIAWFSVNQKRLMGENNELKRALISKQTAQKETGSSHHDKTTSGEPQLTEGDKIALTEAGLKWDGKYFSKKMKSGKTMRRIKRADGSWDTQVV